MSTPAILAARLLGAGAPPDTTGLDVLRLMHDAYASRWPTNVTFVQTSTFHEGDSTRVETWYEAIQSGKLRIDFAPLEAGNGVIFRSDSIYRFQGDSLLGSGPLVHPLMVLSRDVYEMPPERTGERPRRLPLGAPPPPPLPPGGANAPFKADESPEKAFSVPPPV